ncbi:Hypothetical predicted protein [Cloeon dipterum]|uniref:Bee-milk protein n=1 Tax=Cloeon dipterum TaxID=197152 RepID=A0A8S1E214_9INSE|nr:Hypothetical predicted protein [Cloeon dipterum]
MGFSTNSGGVPLTLTWLPTDGPKKNFPKLNPFPSKELQEKLDCNKIHWVKAMQVDSVGLLWAADFGSKICPAKLWIFDLKNNDSIVLVYDFPKEILSHDYHQKSLIDMVVDERMNDTFAYISDHYYGTLIVFSLRTRISRKTNIVMNENFDSIAISSGTGMKFLLFSSRGESGVYALPVFTLRDGKAESVIPFHVGNKASGSFNIIMDSKNILYFDALNKTLIRTWNATMPFKEEYYYLGELDESEPKFCLDHNDHLWLLTRNTVNRSSFRLVRMNFISLKVIETATAGYFSFKIFLKFPDNPLQNLTLKTKQCATEESNCLQATFNRIESYLRETPAYYSGVAMKNRSSSVKLNAPSISSLFLKIDPRHRSNIAPTTNGKSAAMMLPARNSNKNRCNSLVIHELS